MTRHAQAPPSPGAASADRRAQLERLIRRRLVRPVYQPIADLRTGQVVGLEALLRPGPATGFDNAGALFDEAEAAGLLWALEEVARAETLHGAEGRPEGSLLFLNASPRVVADRRFVGSLVEAVEGAGLRPGRIVLEVTERADLQHEAGLTEQIERLKALGFQVALDDVGAGSSGLARVLSVRPHWLKLDRVLVDSIDTDRVRQNLVRFLVHYARLAGLKLIAEGIARREEIATLLEMGVTYGQGFALARPGRADQALRPELLSWLRQGAAGAPAEAPELGLERYARPALTAEAATSLGEIVTALLRDPGLPGVVVVEDRRCIGWCDRQRVLDLARAGRGARPVGHATLEPPLLLERGTPLPEALRLAAARDESRIGEPLLIQDRAGQYRIITTRDLLQAAAESEQVATGRGALLGHLPTRVHADRHITDLIERAAAAPGATGQLDAAIVDIRHFGDYNGVYGYDLGDQLLRRLADLLRRAVVRADESVFLAHLRDDRFLLAGPAEVFAERLASLVEQFEAATGAHCADLALAGDHGLAPAGPGAAALAGLEVGLRIVLLPGVFSRVEEPRDLYRLAESLRARAATTAEASVYDVGSRSVLIEERPLERRLTYRLSA